MANRSLQICALTAFSIIFCTLHSEEILEEAYIDSEYVADLEIDEHCQIHGKAARRNPKRNKARVRSSKKDHYAARSKAIPKKQTTEEDHCAVHGKVGRQQKKGSEEELSVVITQCEQPKPVCKCRPKPCCPKPCPPKPCCPPEPCCPPVCPEERGPAWFKPNIKGAYNYPASIMP